MKSKKRRTERRGGRGRQKDEQQLNKDDLLYKVY